MRRTDQNRSLFLVLLFVFGINSQADLTWDAPDSVVVKSSTCDAESRCQCTVESPSSCELDEEYRQLVEARKQLQDVYSKLSGETLDRIEGELTSLTHRMQSLEVSLHNQSISLSMTELSNLQDQVTGIRQTLQELVANDNSSVAILLQAEVEAIEKSLIVLGTKNPIAVREELDTEIAKLKERLETCATQTSAHGEEGLDFLGDALPFNKTITTTMCPAHPDGITVGVPVTYQYRPGINGMWLKDPLPKSEEIKTRIYGVAHWATTSQNLYYWKNLDDFEAPDFTSRQLTGSCLFHNYGSKPLVVNGRYYYYDGYRSGFAKVIDPWAKPCVTPVSMKFALPGTAYKYLGNAQTHGDFNYDETGLYIVYASGSGDLMISKLNPITMEVEKTWDTGKQKRSIANVFMVCGRLYTTDDFKARHMSGKQWGFDTNTGEEFFHELDIESKFANVQALSYNPRERVIFGWDNQHAVSYPVHF